MPRIFISYRRNDESARAELLYDALVRRFSRRRVFHDSKSLSPGVDFGEAIETTIARCDVLVAVIGPKWVTAQSEHGTRLEDPEDWVRLEISAALKEKIRVVPVLVGGASMPPAEQLPDELKALGRRQTVEIHNSTRKAQERAFVRSLGPWWAWPWLGAAALVLLLAAASTWALTSSDKPKPTAATTGGPVKSGVPPVKIGALYSRAGVGEAANQDLLDGAQFAADYVNSMRLPDSALPLKAGQGLPGLDAARLEVVPIESEKGLKRCRDSLPRGSVAVEDAFERFVRIDGVAGVVGSYESTLTLRAILAAERWHVPLVNGGSTVSSFTAGRTADPRKRSFCDTPVEDPRPSPWFFRVGPTDAKSAEQFRELIAKAQTDRLLPPTSRLKVAILGENKDIYGNGVARNVRTVMTSAGFQMPPDDFGYKSVLTSDSENLDPCTRPDLLRQIRRHVARIAAYDPDVLFLVSYQPDAIAVVQAMAAYGHDGYRPKAIFAYGTGYLDDAFTAGALPARPACGLPETQPPSLTSSVWWAPQVADRNPTARSIAARFKEKYGRSMNLRSAIAFTSALTLAQAINEARSRDPGAIREALTKLRVAGNATIMPWSGIDFDDRTGQNTQARVLLVQLLDQHRYEVVYPDDLDPVPFRLNR